MVHFGVPVRDKLYDGFRVLVSCHRVRETSAPHITRAYQQLLQRLYNTNTNIVGDNNNLVISTFASYIKFPLSVPIHAV